MAESSVFLIPIWWVKVKTESRKIDFWFSLKTISLIDKVSGYRKDIPIKMGNLPHVPLEVVHTYRESKALLRSLIETIYYCTCLNTLPFQSASYQTKVVKYFI